MQRLLDFQSLLLSFGPRVGPRLVFACVGHLQQGEGQHEVQKIGSQSLIWKFLMFNFEALRLINFNQDSF